ncbi:hypothetical protein HII36_21770, partial [Nonomuraea sp. NN258]|uniref:hypothetical protein n=1 Tax=Nonomuraea antri TaxID=2730852 RepID=UPI001569CB06
MTTTPGQYAQAVRDALAGHPDREELLEDLDDHLAEIAAESDVPLEERLGPPAAYAEELVAAYGGRPQGRQKGRLRLRERIFGLHAGLLRHAPYRGFTGFLPELRPGWWVLRGYLLAMLLLTIFANAGPVPRNPVELIVVAGGIWASVWFGRRRPGGRVLVPLTAAVNVVAALALLVGWAAVESTSGRDRSLDAASVYVESASSLGDEVYNIRPYAKDGTPLSDVYLYDQDGEPLTTDWQHRGYVIDKSCGEPVLNRYPLPLVRDQTWSGEGSNPTPA